MRQTGIDWLGIGWNNSRRSQVERRKAGEWRDSVLSWRLPLMDSADVSWAHPPKPIYRPNAIAHPSWCTLKGATSLKAASQGQMMKRDKKASPDKRGEESWEMDRGTAETAECRLQQTAQGDSLTKRWEKAGHYGPGVNTRKHRSSLRMTVKFDSHPDSQKNNKSSHVSD